MFKSKVVHMTVDNIPGVLDQIALLIRRTSWNVRSISANETLDPDVTNINILLEGRGTGARQVAERLEEFSFVREIHLCSEEDCDSTEAALVTVDADPKEMEPLLRRYFVRPAPQAAPGRYEVLGSREEIECFLRECMAIGETKAVRSGPIYLFKEGREER